MKTFRLPDVGEGLQEAEIVSWHVSPGDHVVADQLVVAIETDKAVVELPSPWSGTISKLHSQVGDVVSVGDPLMDLATSESEDAGAIVGTLCGAEKEHVAIEPTRLAHEAGDGHVLEPRAVPRVRAYAAQRGVDLGNVRGTGPQGTIVTGDVDAALAVTRRGTTKYEPLTPPRRALATNMANAGRTVVPATVTDHVDISAWWGSDADITVRAVAALSNAAMEEPAINAWFDGDTMSRRMHDIVNVGLAVDAPAGLFVPVIRDARNRSYSEIRQCIDELVQKANVRSLTSEQMRGATITLSNFGSIAGRHASLVVMPPQVAIVGVGRVETRLVLKDEKVIMRHFLPISITFDHRAVTGGEVTRFLVALKSGLQH